MITFFEVIRNNCKYEHPGYNEDHQLEYTCRHKENQPPGCSWGVCDEAHCPIMKQHKEALIPPMIPPMESTGQEAPMTVADEFRDMMEEPYTYFISFVQEYGSQVGIGSAVVDLYEPIEETLLRNRRTTELNENIAKNLGVDKIIILNIQRL